MKIKEVKNTKYNVEKPFKLKLTTMGSQRFKQLHYNNKRVINILPNGYTTCAKDGETIATPTKIYQEKPLKTRCCGLPNPISTVQIKHQDVRNTLSKFQPDPMVNKLTNTI